MARKLEADQTVTVTASDAAGNTSTGTFIIVVQDTTAPVINSVTPSTGVIWPPNHKMVPITVAVDADDNTGVASVNVISITSNEPDDGKGDGRVYTITVEVTDAYGNVSVATTTVTVPKNGGDYKDEKSSKSEKSTKAASKSVKESKSAKGNAKGKK
ncbi:MAG: hypothetical protein ACO3DQ_04235 [Cephaloticoccus sp.]